MYMAGGYRTVAPKRRKEMIEKRIEERMNEIQKKINKLYHMPKTEKNLERIDNLWEEYEKLERALLQIY